MDRSAFLALLCLCAVFATVSSASDKQITSCYQCNSASDGQEACAESNDLPDSFKKKCSGPNTGDYKNKDPVGCRKILQEVDAVTRTIRECAYSGANVDGVKRTGNKGIRIFYYQCDDDDDCNASSALGASLVAVIVGLSTALRALL